jgi:DNA repair exonuclease SbcCD ATPase subunit
MKATKLHIKNIGLIAEEVLILDKPLILLYGEIRQGKTTILNCVRYVFGGEFPSDLLRHGEREGFIQLDFEDGRVRREFYLSEAGVIKARPVVYVRNGVRVARPVTELEKFLNPFLLDQNHLVDKSELERKKFFAELFHTATEDLDRENAKLSTDAQELRATIKGYGDIDPVPIATVDVSALRTELAGLQRANTDARYAWDKLTLEVRGRADNIAVAQSASSQWAKRIAELEAELAAAKTQLNEVAAWLDTNPPLPVPESPAFTSTSDIEQRISDAAANNVRAEQYAKDKARLDAKIADERHLLDMERRSRAIRDEKIARLDDISAKCGVPGLRFEENGSFIFEDTQPGMLSTSQLMKLSTALSALYPEGLGLDLVDRGESLGKSIFDYVERAKAGNKTILATIVGERPAVVPEHVGVFVVANGKLS